MDISQILGFFRAGLHPPMDRHNCGGGIMKFCIRVARHSRSRGEHYRKFVLKADSWLTVTALASDYLKPGERIVNISESGYQL